MKRSGLTRAALPWLVIASTGCHRSSDWWQQPNPCPPQSTLERVAWTGGAIAAIYCEDHKVFPLLRTPPKPPLPPVDLSRAHGGVFGPGWKTGPSLVSRSELEKLRLSGTLAILPPPAVRRYIQLAADEFQLRPKLEVVIDAEGKASTTLYESSRSASYDALILSETATWTFKPWLENGNAIPVRAIVDLDEYPPDVEHLVEGKFTLFHPTGKKWKEGEIRGWRRHGRRSYWDEHGKLVKVEADSGRGWGVEVVRTQPPVPDPD